MGKDDPPTGGASGGYHTSTGYTSPPASTSNEQLVRIFSEGLKLALAQSQADIKATQQGMLKATQEMTKCVNSMQNHTSTLNATATRGGQKEAATMTLTECDGIAWKNFRSNFEITNEMNGWKDERAILKLRTALRDNAHRAIEHLEFPTGMKIQEALDQIEVIFINPSSTELAMAKFEASTREPGETLLEWHIRVRELYSRAYPDDKSLETSRRLKDRFIFYCRDRALTLCLKLQPTYRDMKFTAALTAAQDYEGAQEAASAAYDGPKRRGIAMQLMESQKLDQEDSEDKDETPLDSQLVNMSDRQIQQLSAHIHRTEPFPMLDKTGNNAAKGACFHCGKDGHLLRACPMFSDAIARIKKNPGHFGLHLAMSRSYSGNHFPSRGGRGQYYPSQGFSRGNFRGSSRGRGQPFHGRGTNRGRPYQRGGRGHFNNPRWNNQKRVWEISAPIEHSPSAANDEVTNEVPYYTPDETDPYAGNE